jgi:isopenicillin-N epimerase
MTLTRRDVLTSTALGAAAGALTGAGAAPAKKPAARAGAGAGPDWSAVRSQFPLDPGYVHLAGLYLTSHPDPVRRAVERHRKGLDANPIGYIQENNRRLEGEARQAAAQYLGARPEDVALTDSTTMGLALVYGGVQVRAGQELLTTEFDYYSTREALQYKADRTGASYREIPLYRDVRKVTEEEIVETLVGAVRPQTRVVTATWVHSATGLKVPVRRIADRLAEINRGRAEADRALLCVDGVHGFGVEDTRVADLGCDFFVAGTHKWIFGPRGTGLIWGNPRSQSAVTPIIPTFSGDSSWGTLMTPGGFQSFEHRWAMPEAFQFHQQLGKAKVRERIHGMSRQLKEGLARMRHVTLYTPMDERLSAGITCFDVQGLAPRQVVTRLREQKIIASTTPYTPTYARLAPGIFNSPEEVEQALGAIRGLA